MRMILMAAVVAPMLALAPVAAFAEETHPSGNAPTDSGQPAAPTNDQGQTKTQSGSADNPTGCKEGVPDCPKKSEDSAKGATNK